MTLGDEQWLPVVGYEGCYEVSDQGRVRSLDRKVLRAGVQKAVRGRVLAQGDSGSGRRAVSLSRDGRAKTARVARLVLEAFVGPRPDKYDACHNDGDVLNNQVDNLRWATRSANMLDAVEHSTHNNARKERCKRGHLLQAPNLSRAASNVGERACRSCNRATTARWKAHRAGTSFDGVQAVADQHYTLIMGSAP